MASVLFIANDLEFFISHRLPIAISAIKNGYTVHVASPESVFSKDLISQGIHCHSIKMTRSGLNIFGEIASLISIFAVIKKVNPDILHLVTIKPVLYGGTIARMLRINGVVIAISGLGTVFHSSSLLTTILRYPVYLLYFYILGQKNYYAVFQNKNDKEKLNKIRKINKGRQMIVPGSGVDLSLYPHNMSDHKNTPIISFASRLLIDKGTRIFVEAAEILHQRGVNARFWLIGKPDPGNPRTIKQNELEIWKKEGNVEILGYRDDIPVLFSKSDIVAFPSYYGEGLPKVLIEAAACGKVIVTTDHPGCRDAIIPGVTGILVPIRDSLALANALERLVNDTELRDFMGREGRQLAEERYSIDKVVSAHMKIYHNLLNRA